MYTASTQQVNFDGLMDGKCEKSSGRGLGRSVKPLGGRSGYIPSNQNPHIWCYQPTFLPQAIGI